MLPTVFHSDKQPNEMIIRDNHDLVRNNSEFGGERYERLRDNDT